MKTMGQSILLEVLKQLLKFTYALEMDASEEDGTIRLLRSLKTIDKINIRPGDG